MRFVDISGQKFGRLTVIERVETPKHIKSKSTYWKCKCDCGNEIIVRGANLKNGTTKSCGCIQANVCRNNFKKYNTYDLSGDFGIGYDAHGNSFLFDIEDYELIKDYCWNVHKEYRKKSDGREVSVGYYVTGRDTNKSRKIIRMHRLIMNVLDNPNVLVDHDDHNGLNNQKYNLRICNFAENAWNSKPRQQKNKISIYKGVTYNKGATKKWRAVITCNKVKYELGSFDTEVEAAIAYNEKAKELYGEFAYLNEIKTEVI